VRSLSLGQRTRSDLCAALLHEPDLLFLDEPTIGLDVVAKERIRQFIDYAHREKHTTILLTTHDLSDVEKLCERVIIIDRGKILYDGHLSKLVEKFEKKRSLVVVFNEDYDTVDFNGLKVAQREGRRVTYSVLTKENSIPETIQKLLGRFQVADIEIRHAELSDTIRRIYEEQLLSPGLSGDKE